MLNVTSIAESVAVSAPVQREVPSVVSAAGVSDAAALARQQLAYAVPAPVQVAAYAAYMPSAYRPPVRTVSSSLAAQFIAQGATASNDHSFAIFEPPAAPNTNIIALQDAYVNDIRTARGNIDAATQQLAMSEGHVPVKNDINSTKNTDNYKASSKDILTHPETVQLMAALPPLSVIKGRQTGIANVRGIGAYRLASSRNAAMHKQSVNESVGTAD